MLLILAHCVYGTHVHYQETCNLLLLQQAVYSSVLAVRITVPFLFVIVARPIGRV